MKTILSLFSFQQHEIGLVLGRLGLEVVVCALVAYLTALVILSFTKSKKQEIGFSNWFKICYMIGIDVAILSLGIIIIYILHVNGLWYFSRWAWDWTNGYLLVLPEVSLMIGMLILYWILNQNIKKSI